MITKRYMALSLVPLGMSLLGFMALCAPAPLRGPLLTTHFEGGLAALNHAVYLAHAVGLILLALATFEIWVIAITWEYRRQRMS